MNVIYLHGFQSSAMSVKGQMLKRYCEDWTGAQTDGIQVHLPDLNLAPVQALQQVSQLIEQLGAAKTVLAGSSLGGFYALQLAAKHQLPAVLINPAMQPWSLFRRIFSDEQLPYAVTDAWSLDQAQFNALEKMAIDQYSGHVPVLVLLQQGDEVLDYREAQAFFSQPETQAVVISESHGNHGMDDFSQKIPMILQFLSCHAAR